VFVEMMNRRFYPLVPDRNLCAGLFFYGILPAFEDFIKADRKAATWCKNADFLCRFYNRAGDEAFLRLKKGTVQYLRTTPDSPGLSVCLGSVERTASLVQGRWAPIYPVRGCFRVSSLVLLARLFLRFQRLLRPSSKDLQDDEFRKLHVRLALSVALFSVCEIGQKDLRARIILSNMPEGLVRFYVKGEEWEATIENQKQELQANRGYERGIVPDAEILFSQPRVAMEILTQKRDSHEALACGDLKVTGLIPLADAMGLILDRVSLYLPQ